MATCPAVVSTTESRWAADTPRPGRAMTDGGVLRTTGETTMAIHPIDRIQDECVDLVGFGTAIETVIKHAIVQGWSAGWDAGSKNRLAQQAAAERYTEDVRLKIEAARQKFADLAERILNLEQ
jgi:hypothetical protein